MDSQALVLGRSKKPTAAQSPCSVMLSLPPTPWECQRQPPVPPITLRVCSAKWSHASPDICIAVQRFCLVSAPGGGWASASCGWDFAHWAYMPSNHQTALPNLASVGEMYRKLEIHFRWYVWNQDDYSLPYFCYWGDPGVLIKVWFRFKVHFLIFKGKEAMALFLSQKPSMHLKIYSALGMAYLNDVWTAAKDCCSLHTERLSHNSQQHFLLTSSLMKFFGNPKGLFTNRHFGAVLLKDIMLLLSLDWF